MVRLFGQVTMGPFVPPIVLAISKNPIVENYDLSSVKMVLSGAAPLGKELEDAFRARLPNAVLGQVSLHLDSLLLTFFIGSCYLCKSKPLGLQSKHRVTQKHNFWVGGNSECRPGQQLSYFWYKSEM